MDPHIVMADARRRVVAHITAAHVRGAGAALVAAAALLARAAVIAVARALWGGQSARQLFSLVSAAARAARVDSHGAVAYRRVATLAFEQVGVGVRRGAGGRAEALLEGERH